MKFLLGVCIAISLVFAFAWIIGGGIEPAAFIIVAVPWLFVAVHALLGNSNGCTDYCMGSPQYRATSPLCKKCRE